MQSEYYMNGHDGFYQGDDRDENPYAPGTAAHEEWDRGFVDAYENYDPTPCCPAPGESGCDRTTCRFPGYAANH